MKIVVIGGTGLIGSKVVSRLSEQGHEVLAAAPSTGIDILTGAGLDDAMAGTDIVVDLANSPSFADDAVLSFFQTAGRNVLGAETRAGVRHHVALSVVGTAKLVESGYFRGKIAQEALIRQSGVAYTIVHSTQFLEFLPGIVNAAVEGGQVRLSPALIQPIAAEEVAEAVARIALQAPQNGIVEIAGPERMSLSDLARRFMDATGDQREVVSDADARYFGARLQQDTLVPSGMPWLGSITFDQWVARSGLAGAAAHT
ncbi:SDR family oxidoreductase [Pseudoxanthomonas sp.]|uniref:SDR family oxidoreductase n=1 Tax=Pseudoxanthomonas sp. TaxID=1871049 RepID=UPI0026384ADE|nr:SDR family oxidoreductase [Pseudoxanthomonas sp.]WDS36980.1 MAG: SDR family oxidoreductase [Pseudoxanthomonas sp.]